jgi:outer membrane protein assembly factor BamB
MTALEIRIRNFKGGASQRYFEVISLTTKRIHQYVACSRASMQRNVSKFCKTISAGIVLALWANLLAAEKTLTPEWSATIGYMSDSSPALGPDGTIYFGTFDGKLWALKPDGSRKWVFRASSEIKSSPALAPDGTSYFGSRDRKFYAVGADGKKRWEFKTGGWVDSSPALAKDGTIYFGSWDKIFYALNPDGSRKWEFKIDGEITSSPAIGADGTIYFGSHDMKFYALDAEGKKKWDYETGGQIISSPAINADECIYFTSVDGYFYALNFDGTLRWRLRTGGITESSPVISEDGMIYVGVNHGLWAITAAGKQKWMRSVDLPVEAAPVVLADQTVCFISRQGSMIDVDSERTTLWSYYCYGYGYASPAMSPSGKLYFSDRGAYFSAIPVGGALAKSPWPKFRGNARNTGNINDRER